MTKFVKPQDIRKKVIPQNVTLITNITQPNKKTTKQENMNKNSKIKTKNNFDE